MKDYVVNDLFPVRKHNRLTVYDYSLPGAYFITICTHYKNSLFGKIENRIMYTNTFGKIVQSCWNDLTTHYAGISNDIFVVMPNHVHGVILIHDEIGREGYKPSPTKPHHLSEIVRAFKTYSAKGINGIRKSPGVSVWQRSFYEHVIRDEKEYHEIGEYIINNPAKWESDKENISKI